MKLKSLLAALAISSALSAPAAADTSLELLQGWNYNEDFNGDSTRTTLTIKTFQWWQYGTFFMYYDITGPFATMDAESLPNEKAGFFGGTSVTFSIKRIGQKLAGTEWDWGPLLDLSARYEIEHVSKFGTLSYYGLEYALKVPGFDFVSATTNIRDDWALSGIDLQVGGAWQLTLPLGDITDLVFAGFFQAGILGEGDGEFTVVERAMDTNAINVVARIPQQGRWFFLSQPQLMFDIGKLTRQVDGKLYLGLEYQVAFNRYLLDGVSEHVPQLMFKWNI